MIMYVYVAGQNQLPSRDSIDGLFDKLKHIFPSSSEAPVDDSTLSS